MGPGGIFPRFFYCYEKFRVAGYELRVPTQAFHGFRVARRDVKNCLEKKREARSRKQESKATTRIFSWFQGVPKDVKSCYEKFPREVGKRIPHAETRKRREKEPFHGFRVAERARVVRSRAQISRSSNVLIGQFLMKSSDFIERKFPGGVAQD